MRSPKSIFTIPGHFTSQISQRPSAPPSRATRKGLSTPPKIGVERGSARTLDQVSTSTSSTAYFSPSIQRTPQSKWNCELERAALSSAPSDTVIADISHTQFSAPDLCQKRALPTEPVQSDWQDGLCSSNKKRRTSFGTHYNLDLSAFRNEVSQETGPSSPLFFSGPPRRRPLLPPRLSSSETGAAMLMRTGRAGRRATDVGVYRQGTSGTRDGANTSKRNSISANNGLEPEGKQLGMQMLGQIGITEFLEQDERPTFIIDIGDPDNLSDGPLRILFANVALRSRPELVKTFSHKAHHGPPGYPDFRAWLTSSVKNQQPPQAFPQYFTYANFLWTCSTVRTRLRICSGIYRSVSTQTSLTPLVEGCSAASSDNYEGLDRSIIPNYNHPPETVSEEAPEYFSGTVLVSASELMDGVQDGVNSRFNTIKPSTYDASNDLAKPIVNGEMVIGARTITGNSSESSSDYTAPSRETSAAAVASREGTTHNLQNAVRQPRFDWTRMPPSPALPKHIQFFLSVDWASTGLGPIEQWSSSLRAMSNLVMASPHPAAMYWGHEYIAIYNEAYIQLAGQKHPTLMGTPYYNAWPEIWDAVKDVFADAKLTGQATMKDDDCLFMKRSGFLEETYFSWAIVPLVGESGEVVGLYNPAFELTRRKIAERRMLTLREIGERTATAREVRDFWGQVLGGLRYNEYDTPFVLLYSVSEEVEGDDSLTKSEQCVLEGALGVPEGHEAAPPRIDLRAGLEGFGPVFRQAMNTDHPVLLKTDNGTLSPDLIDGFDCRGFGDPCRAAVVCSIQPTTSESILGFLVMGINPRRPYDDDYSLFVQLLSRQLGTSLASVVLFEEEIRRGQRAARIAALDRIELSEQLAARTQEAMESETRFTRMAELSPVGMFIADSNGRINYCNETWYKLSSRTREDNGTDDWIESVKDEDQDMVRNLWATLLEQRVPMTAEFRFKTPWEDRNGNTGDTWVLASAYPERDQDGVLKSVFGSVTNISQQKWAEDFQKRKMEEAVELKRQQENFIDMTSHEMRNPLSAILQCADGISTSLAEFRSKQNDGSLPLNLLDTNVDAAQTIILCAQHQKRIVDDVLTLSKLDSALLLVTPVDYQPVKVAQRALKMFEAEMATANIKTKFCVDNTMRDLGIDWIRADPSRLLQVLINLTTNAIKFTTTQAKRTITVTLSASLQRPAENECCHVSYFPTRSKRTDFTTGRDWGHGQKVFIHFGVQDTGRGLTEAEKKLLFQRFSQASPRTHVQYGGSGLGLFISRELVELQGGAIGVSSERGKGSTFAFYVEARKSSAPADAIEHPTAPRPAENGHSRRTQNTALQDPMIRISVKVLIVEDNLVNQRVLQQQLRNLGCTVYVANHGEEALDHLKRSTYWQSHRSDGLDISVVLMDVEMPVMDGLTCARRIRELQKSGDLLRHVPIIAVTANARVEQIDTALAAGMDDVVSKPFRIPELMPKIAELIARYQNQTGNGSSSPSYDRDDTVQT
ncbi:hypothetical protein MMC16_000970 [Acarospora aff. strigata]|nr:hypothetical protein [Acarospora aff. strigata]